MKPSGMFLRDRVSWFWAPALWILVQLPYLAGPFRIDDPYHIAAAHQMRRDSSDPYGFRINWDGTPKSAFVTYASPPLVPAWLALWSCFFPESEVSLHVAMLPFSLVALATFGVLASSFGVHPGLTMALLACSPAFFLGSQVLMPDIAMLCFFLLAVTGARWYQLERSKHAAALAMVAGACCPLAKYNGAVVIPVLLCMGLAEWVARRKADQTSVAGLRRWNGSIAPDMFAIIAAPVLSLACWGTFTWWKYGAVHFLAMTAFQRGQAHSLDPAALTAGVLGAMGIGVVPLSLPGFLFKARSSSGWLSTLALIGGGGAVWLAIVNRYEMSSALLFGFSVSVSAFVLAWIVRAGWRAAITRDWTGIVLVAWILAGMAFQYGLMFSAVRYLLFLAPPVILLTLRLSTWTPQEDLPIATLAVNLLFVIALGIADARQASVYRSVVADEIRPRLEKTGGRLYFDGHWGFQYYAERLGGEPLDELQPPRYRAGDLVAVAKMPWPKLKHPLQAEGWEIKATTLAVPSSGWLRTLSCGAGASFYASVLPDCDRPTWLPFGFSHEALESFRFYEVSRPAVHAGPILQGAILSRPPGRTERGKGF